MTFTVPINHLVPISRTRIQTMIKELIQSPSRMNFGFSWQIGL